MVAGTGHDFLNRHSCDNGFFIRTPLIKDIAWNLDPLNKFNVSDGYAKFGVGLTFNEIHNASAKVNRLISSGWASTVGIVGWSLGGGHGPFAPGAGLGVDNILEVELVNA